MSLQENRIALSVPEAAEALGGVSENTIWNLLREGSLRRLKVGRRTLIPVSSIEEFAGSPHGHAGKFEEVERHESSSS
ncbi:MAG: helix-turn-helix domain-containing protein [Acidobacteria bacterium]|nr:helix-turn-helix domain-containing protein [Acidobacteriota bacterium]